MFICSTHASRNHVFYPRHPMLSIHPCIRQKHMFDHATLCYHFNQTATTSRAAPISLCCPSARASQPSTASRAAACGSRRAKLYVFCLIVLREGHAMRGASVFVDAVQRQQCFSIHYLSNATCLIRPHLFYARFVVSWITVICNIIRHA